MGVLDKLKRSLQPPSKTKVFCIGFNKTGTTTLENVLIDLGYKMPRQYTQEELLVEDYFSGNYGPLYEMCKEFDAFQDMPFSQGVAYAVVDALFPGSKFILTVREPNAWFDSLVRFSLKGFLKRAGLESIEKFNEETLKNKAVYHHENFMYNIVKRHAFKAPDNEAQYDWSLVYNREHRIEQYEQRNKDILSHFQDRQDQLLVIDISKEENNAKIVKFLGLPESQIRALPHLNKSK